MTAFERIMSTQVPRWAEEFDAKNKDYNSGVNGWEPHTFLGVRGQFADIWRKVGKLKKSLWDEEALSGEQPPEIIRDLISHLFLTLDLMETGLPVEAALADETEAAAVVEKHSRPVSVYLKDYTGHRYDGCQVCVNAREQFPDLIV